MAAGRLGPRLAFPYVSATAEVAAEVRAAYRTLCDCGAIVVEAPLRTGGEVLLETVELLAPMACPTCRSTRQRNREIVCWRCHDVGRIGERLDFPVVMLAEDGLARRLSSCRWRQPGDSVHREHCCCG